MSARLSGAIVSTSLEMVSGAHSTKQHVNKHPSRIPSDRTAQKRIWRRGLTPSLKSSLRGSSPGPGGCTFEHLKALLEDSNAFDLLIEELNSLAQAAVPQVIADVLMSAKLTAIAKKDGGVRGIATGTTLRRVVGRILAKQYMKDFEDERSPFQYAHSTRAGTDCVGHMLRAATDRDPSATVLKVDGIGAYDHVLRSAMLVRLSGMPGARALLPSYANPSSYLWFDNQGQRRTVTQAEGGEQGDPLMPLLFSFGIQGALEEVYSCALSWTTCTSCASVESVSCTTGWAKRC